MNRNDTPSEESDRKCPDAGLATTSVVLAFVMEAPCGIEAGLIYGKLWESSIYLVLFARVTCLAIIFLPLVIYVSRYGPGAMKCVRGRVATVLIMTAIFLAHNLAMLWLSYSR
jgi:hypothetical protein